MKSLSGNSTSRIWVKIRNKQRCHTGQYRVGYLIQLGDPIDELHPQVRLQRCEIDYRRRR